DVFFRTRSLAVLGHRDRRDEEGEKRQGARGYVGDDGAHGGENSTALRVLSHFFAAMRTYMPQRVIRFGLETFRDVDERTAARRGSRRSVPESTPPGATRSKWALHLDARLARDSMRSRKDIAMDVFGQ